MKKIYIIIILLYILAAMTVVACKRSENMIYSESIESSTAAVEITSTEELSTEEATTQDSFVDKGLADLAQTYDSDRIIIKKWIYLNNGWAPQIVEIDGIEYSYGRNEYGFITTIRGSDGSVTTRNYIIDNFNPVLIEENKNGKHIKYCEDSTQAPRYTGFQYEGLNYTYIFENYVITGIKDEYGNVVAEYEYYYENNYRSIRTINHTDEKIGDINTLKYCCNYMPFDMAFEIDAYYPITYYLTENGCRGQQIYLPGNIYGEHCGL